jgi:hypothetical protein
MSAMMEIILAVFFYTLAANTPYRFVLDPSAAQTNPRECTIGTGSDADLKKLLPMDGECYQCTESGGAWTDEDTKIPGIILLLLPIIPDFPDAANVWKSSGDTVNGVAGTMTAANITVTNGDAATLTAPDIKTGVIVDPGADHIDGSAAGGGGIIVIED